MPSITQTYTRLQSDLAALIPKQKFSKDINLKLERITRLLEILGNPQNDYPSIHIAGTSGKGSTSTMIAAILKAAGLKTALHTSPHLQVLNERHQINAKMAPTTTLVQLLDEMKPAIEQVEKEMPQFGKPSYFEVQLALSLLWYSREKVDVAVVETGLGGRLDATNVLPEVVSVLTSIGLDHVEILGDTVAKIAAEKAGIIKATTQFVVCGAAHPDARRVVAEKADEFGATLFQFEQVGGGEAGNVFTIALPSGGLIETVKLGAIGAFQQINAAVAVAAVDAFSQTDVPVAKKLLTKSGELRRRPIRKGLRGVSFAGRMEQMQSRPTVILDGAHNDDKMKAAVSAINAHHAGKKRIVVLGMKAGKDVGAVLPQVLQEANADVLITTEFIPKGLWEAVDAEELSAVAISNLQSPNIPIHIEPDPIKAVELALSLASPDDLVWVTGSLYLVGDVREYWHPLDAQLADLEIAKFEKTYRWLYSLMLDPSGGLFLADKTAEKRLSDYKERMIRIADFMDFIGNPQNDYKSIHVAGTSGKGSVVAMVDGLLQAMGKRTGFHVSPYLQIPNEKLIVDNTLISPTDFNILMHKFRQLYTAYTQAGHKFDFIKYGEAWVAFTYFWAKEVGVAWLVMETGSGGRYDPTNIIDSDVAIVTNIDKDHVKSLGPDITDIARHKAGIIKPNKPVVTAAKQAKVLAVIEAEAKAKNAPLYRLHREFSYEVRETDSEGMTICVSTPHGVIEHVRVGLRGEYQAENAAVAITAVSLIDPTIITKPAPIRTALTNLQFGGRMEVMQTEPLVIIDGAHNPAKMESLVKNVTKLYPDKHITAIVGMLATKDATSQLKHLAPHVKRWAITQPKVYGKPSTSPQELAEMAKQLSDKPMELFEDVEGAISAVIPTLNPQTDLLLITGSLYLIGDARGHWYPRQDLLRNLELQS